MNIGIIVAKFLANTISAAGILIFLNVPDAGPSVQPHEVCPHDKILITEPTGFGLALAVRTPDGFHLILADHGFATVVPNYWTSLSVSLPARDLIGFDYNEDGPYVRPVFDVPGIYEFYFAENLETERENTIGFSVYVEYLGQEHPDC